MYDYICVLDFEATCSEDKKFKPSHEIIEFPSVLLQRNGNEYIKIDQIPPGEGWF